jgi:hypothetical protein
MRYFFTFILTLSILGKGFTQQNPASNIDIYKVNFGFLVGLNSSTFFITKKPDYRSYDSLQTIIAQSNTGFNLGLISNFKLSSNFDLRITPTLSFVDRSITYSYIDNKLNAYKPIESTYVDFPINLKLKSIRLRNVRVYVIGGIKPAIDVISQKKFDDTDLPEEDKRVKLKRFNASWEAGVGLDLYYLYFKMSPEIKISRGFTNILRTENNRFSRPLDGLFTQLFTFNLYFE